MRTPVGDAWILARDEPSFHGAPTPAASARLLPNGDAYFLLHGTDRTLLVGDAARPRELWTPRVWRDALLVGDEIVAWRRARESVTIQPWRRPRPRHAMPFQEGGRVLALPRIEGRSIVVRWED